MVPSHSQSEVSPFRFFRRFIAPHPAVSHYFNRPFFSHVQLHSTYPWNCKYLWSHPQPDEHMPWQIPRSDVSTGSLLIIIVMKRFSDALTSWRTTATLSPQLWYCIHYTHHIIPLTVPVSTKPMGMRGLKMLKTTKVTITAAPVV